jgi:hypothetical protein
MIAARHTSCVSTKSNGSYKYIVEHICFYFVINQYYKPNNLDGTNFRINNKLIIPSI